MKAARGRELTRIERDEVRQYAELQLLTRASFERAMDPRLSPQERARAQRPHLDSIAQATRIARRLELAGSDGPPEDESPFTQTKEERP